MYKQIGKSNEGNNDINKKHSGKCGYVYNLGMNKRIPKII